MPSLDDLEEPTDREQKLTEVTLEAINNSDRLGIVPFFDRETDERVLFLVAIRDEEDDSVTMHPLGPLYDFEETQERFEMPDELKF